MRIRDLFGKIALAAALSLIVVALNPVTAKAEEGKTYTVTFRPGDVGRFALGERTGDAKADAEAVAATVYDGMEYEVTDNGAIKVSVPKGATVEAPTYVDTDENYFVLSDWYTGSDQAVTKNTEYVVDYGRLTDGVEYTVRYVVIGTETSIRPIYITKANIGETVTFSAPKEIILSGVARFFLEGSVTQSLTLTDDQTKNVITFAYSIQDSPMTEEELLSILGGGTITTVIPNGPIVGGAAPAAVAPGGAAVAEEATAPAETVTITEPETALASGISDEGTTIEDTETPLASGLEASPSYTLYIALALVVAAAIIVLLILNNRRKVKNIEESNTEEK